MAAACAGFRRIGSAPVEPGAVVQSLTRKATGGMPVAFGIGDLFHMLRIELRRLVQCDVRIGQH